MPKNKDLTPQQIAANHKWHSDNRERLKAVRKARNVRDKDKVAKIARASALKAKFGITIDDYERLLKKQRGKCKICKVAQLRTMHTDHCHQTGKVRGLLCGKCNMGLGLFNDDEKVLSAALAYLKESKHGS